MRDEVPDSGDNTDEADVEDILGRGFYVTLVNAAYGLKAANKLAASKPKDVPVRVALEVSDRFKTMPANGGRVRPLRTRRLPRHASGRRVGSSPERGTRTLRGAVQGAEQSAVVRPTILVVVAGRSCRTGVVRSWLSAETQA